MTSSRIVVSGASGHLAGGILTHLAALGADAFGTSRSPGPAHGAVEVRHGDFADPAGLAEAWRGAAVLVLVPGGDLGAGRTEQHARALEAAVAAGVRHVVYPGVVAHGDAPTLADDHLATEQLLRESGLAWTVLRNGIYADLLVERAVASGEVVFGGGAGRVAWVARGDLAEAAAVVAADAAAHRGHTFELTGPEALSLTDVGVAVAGVLGRDVPVTALDAEAFAGGMAAQGAPPVVVAAMRGTTQAVEAGRLERVTGDLAELLGRAPATVADVTRAVLRAQARDAA